jgi:hypothetical protein
MTWDGTTGAREHGSAINHAHNMAEIYYCPSRSALRCAWVKNPV